MPISSNTQAAACPPGVSLQWDVRIPLRDGVQLSALLYSPPQSAARSPVIFALTPYVSQSLHPQGIFFASNGYRFVAVDMRGRGNSTGEFDPCGDNGLDGYDVCEWLAAQDYSNGQVAMWGGSIAGYLQWLTAAQQPPHLVTIAPAASPFRGLDTPMRNNIFGPHRIQWLNLIAGRASQDRIFADQAFWSRRFREWHESGTCFRHIDTFLGMPSDTWQAWMDHPRQGAYWDRQNPTDDQYGAMGRPALTITGIYDANQPGAIEHYRRHTQLNAAAARAHHLVIGPWDHAGTRAPAVMSGGPKVSAAGLIDLQQLHLEWYEWTMRGAPKPRFLKERVAYYVLQADVWRYAEDLAGVTARHHPLYLSISGDPSPDGLTGQMLSAAPAEFARAAYVYDPDDLSSLRLEQEIGRNNFTDSRLITARAGRQLRFESAPFVHDTEISGFFTLESWLAIDQPDTDFEVAIHVVEENGASLFLTNDLMRARHRTGLRDERLVDSREPLLYTFERFMFTSCLVRRGSRLRLVLGPVDSLYAQRNFNAALPVADQTRADARVVNVELHCSPERPALLKVPIARSP